MAVSAEEIRARDAAARQAAQTVFDRPLVIEAGAGTGKTRTLVARVVVWCLGPGWERARAALQAPAAATLGGPSNDRIATRVLQRVVAMTFTEAAAAEMAERIAESLAQIARGEAVIGVAADLLPEQEEERRERARVLLARLDHLVVRTIHAFCRRLLTTYPIEAGLHPHFQVDAEGVLQAQVLREVIDARLHAAYADPGDPGFLALAEQEQGPTEIEAALHTLLQIGARPEDLEDDPFSEAKVDAFFDELRSLLEGMASAEGGRLASARPRNPRSEKMMQGVHANLHAMQSRVTARSISSLYDRLASSWPEENLARLRKWASGDFAAGERVALGDHCLQLAPLSIELRAKLAHLADLDPQRLTLARQVLRPLLAEAYLELRRRGIETFPLLLRDALTLLHDQPDTAQRVRSSMDQLLVDEFQDTDATQTGIVRLLALTGDVAKRPGLFLVGDPKQSIYGWRSADLRAYDEFIAEVWKCGGETHHLSVSFRSVPAILEEVERVVRPVMLAEPGVQPAFQPLVPCAALAQATGFTDGQQQPVEYWISWQASETTAAASTTAAAANRVEARALARDLATLHGQHAVPWSDIAILLRSSGDIETYLSALREAGVPFLVDHDRSYYQRREVIDAWALVQIVLEPADHVALVTWLRSAVVGVPDAALIPLWAEGFAELVTELVHPDTAALAEIDACIAAAVDQTPDDVPGIERVRGWEHSLRAAVRQLAALRESFRCDACDVMVDKLRTMLLSDATEAARYLGRYRLANLERFYSRLLAALENVGGDAHAVLRVLRVSIEESQQADEARPQDVGEDGVLVTTIHQAKGLDFAHVYIMQMHKASPPPKSLPNDAGMVGGRLEYRLFGAPTLSFGAVERQRQEIEAAERVRTLYVAMTRAKQRLVLAGCWGKVARIREVAAARSYADLLNHRTEAPPDLGELWRQAVESKSAHTVAGQALWSFPGLHPLQEEGAASPARATLSREDVAAIAADSARLRDLRFAAQQRQCRSISAPISAEAHKELHEVLAQRFETAGAADPSEDRFAASAAQRIALAAGTTVHRLLERLDLANDPQTQWPSQLENLKTCLPTTLDDSDSVAVCARAAAILQHFREGPLWQRFLALWPHVVARELAVLVPATGTARDAPLEFLRGAIDLVCRDPLDGALFVVDYKTDIVRSEAELDERVQAYASQIHLYARALQDALALKQPPRGELWFLEAGVVR